MLKFYKNYQKKVLVSFQEKLDFFYNLTKFLKYTFIPKRNDFFRHFRLFCVKINHFRQKKNHQDQKLTFTDIYIKIKN